MPVHASDVWETAPRGSAQSSSNVTSQEDFVQTSITGHTQEIEYKLKHDFFERAFDVEGFYDKFFPTQVDEPILRKLGAFDPGHWPRWPHQLSQGTSPEAEMASFFMTMQSSLLESLKNLSLDLPEFRYCDSQDTNTQHLDGELHRPDIVMVSAGWAAPRVQTPHLVNNSVGMSMWNDSVNLPLLGNQIPEGIPGDSIGFKIKNVSPRALCRGYRVATLRTTSSGLLLFQRSDYCPQPPWPDFCWLLSHG